MTDPSSFSDDVQSERRTDERRVGDRRKNQVAYSGPDRRKHVRRSGEERRA